MVRVIEGFNPQGITGKSEAFFSGIPDGEGKHTIEAGEAVSAVLGPGLEENFRIGLGLKHDSPCLQIPPKFHVVVNFPVKDDVPSTIGGRHGLATAGEVENA